MPSSTLSRLLARLGILLMTSGTGGEMQPASMAALVPSSTLEPTNLTLHLMRSGMESLSGMESGLGVGLCSSGMDSGLSGMESGLSGRFAQI